MDLTEANRRLWNRWARLHLGSAFYDVAGFREGRSSLHEVELRELGPEVAGRTLLHLQCHFGLDTLSWARLGARVTGVDLAEDAIDAAHSLSEELGIGAKFVRADIYDLPEALDARFDIVYTSYGVLCWLPDLEGWARVVAGALRPGGTFYMAEFRPVLAALDEAGERLTGDYFARAPVRYETAGSYAAADPEGALEAYEWTHGLGEVVTALVGAGLRLEYLHEFPFTVENYWPTALEEGESGRYHLRGRPSSLPLLFSLRAHLPG